MQFINFRYLIIGTVMLAAAGLAFALTPREKVADHGPRIDLETMVPKQFGEWRMDESLIPIQVSPEVKAKLDKIYNQTLTRTYINEKGERLMLSIAYGGDQTDSMQMHKPEVCYPAQGFQVLKNVVEDNIQGPHGLIPVRRLVASNGSRIEPITYWIRVGRKVTEDGWPRKFEQLRFGLTGQVPDGLLFRVSSLGSDAKANYKTHDDFIRSLLATSTEEAKSHLLGKGA